MLEEIRGLLILQDRDRRLLTLNKELGKLPQDEARAKAKLAGDTDGLKRAHDELKAVELKVKKIELDAQTRRTTVERLQKQQFETKKNDEFNALGHEIVRYQKEVDELETKELQAMEEIDAFRDKQTVAEMLLARTRKVVDEDLVLIKERHAKMAEQVKEVSADREKLVKDISEDILPLYEKLMKSKDGMAIATLKDGKCTGCHMKVIASTVIGVQREEEVMQCENCGRLLSMDE